MLGDFVFVHKHKDARRRTKCSQPVLIYANIAFLFGVMLSALRNRRRIGLEQLRVLRVEGLSEASERIVNHLNEQ